MILAFALVYVFWGSTYLAIGISDEEHLPPAVMCAMRFVIAGPLMLAACAAMGRNIRITWNEGVRLATIGCLLLVGGNCGLAWAEQWVPTGFAALIIAVTPIWFLLLEKFVFRGDRLSARGVFGVALGIAGVALLFWSKFEQRASGNHAAAGRRHSAVLVVELVDRIRVIAQLADEGRSLHGNRMADGVRCRSAMQSWR